jgi:hypothetical protein
MRARSRFRSTIVRLLLLLPAALWLPAAAGAVPTLYTDSGDFLTALPGAATTASFDSLSSGDTIASGGSADGITFTYAFGGGVELIVTDGTAAGGGGPFDTTSPPNFLGTTDFDVLLDGDDLVLGFSSANAIGLFIITAEDPGVTLFDGDIGLTAGGATAFLDVDAVEQTLSDGIVFFLGVIDPAAGFTSASLDTYGGGGAFAYNVDDVVTAVPEPGTALVLGLGLLILCRLRA